MNRRRVCLGVAAACGISLGALGCSKKESPATPAGGQPTAVSTDTPPSTSIAANSSAAVEVPATATSEDVDAAKKRLTELGPVAKLSMQGPRLTEISILEGSNVSEADIALIGRLTDLQKLQIYNCRTLNSAMVAQLSGLKGLTSLALTNTIIDDAAVESIVKSFPNLVELDLSSNANMSSSALKLISELVHLQRLTLVQNRFNELSTRRLSKLPDLRVLDLRGNMEAGDMTLEVVAELPKLTSFKHRSTAVTDYGMEQLSRNGTIDSLLIQDFAITSQSGAHLAKLSKLKQLEIFRCQGFGSEGVLGLKGLHLERLTLRDLPNADDQALDVLNALPMLRRLYLHEISGFTDTGLKNLGALKSLELLDIWSLPQMTDATMDVIATLPELKELSVRSTAITDASIDAILKMPKLQLLTVKENSSISEEGIKRLAAKKWTKLDVGAAESSE